ncbi:MAG: SDR family oxidoreductase [Steroidobacteraceae bacterium]
MTSYDNTAVPDYRSMTRLDGKSFVVIGAGQGIGRQTAHALVQAGAQVACVGRSADLTEAVAREVRGVAILGDATVRADVERIFDSARSHLGGVNGVVDTLGMVRRKPLLEFTDADWDWQFDVVLRHAFLVTQIGGLAVAAGGGGSLTFVGSVASLVGSDNHTVYGAAKAALNHMVRAAALELAPHGVRINVVAPSVVTTPRVQGWIDQGHGRDAVQYFPLGRLAQPADVAAAILAMASGLHGYVTGQTLLVDGGMLAQSPMPDSVWFEKK